MKPGDLSWLRAAIFFHLQNSAALPLSQADPWLDWLGVPWSPGMGTEIGPMEPVGLDFGAAELKAMGMLPEVVYSGLVQTWWHPQQTSFVTRTRSEIVACFDPKEMDVPGWSLDLPALERMNAYRLQELTPLELLAAAGQESDGEGISEAWVLLCQPGFRSLGDVVQCLKVFETGCSELELPEGVDVELAREVLAQRLFT